jgi:hypothetical protein
MATVLTPAKHDLEAALRDRRPLPATRWAERPLRPTAEAQESWPGRRGLFAWLDLALRTAVAAVLVAAGLALVLLALVPVAFAPLLLLFFGLTPLLIPALGFLLTEEAGLLDEPVHGGPGGP